MYCNFYRGDFIESSHQVHAVVLDEQRKVLFQSGDLNHITCIRSSFKPFQAYPFIHHNGHIKYNFTPSEIALLCASHNGEKIHTNTAKAMLQKIKMNHTNLECGTHLPADKITRKRFIQNNHTLTTLYNNCSGKHIGMLGLTQLLKYNRKHYIHIEHPIQKKIFQFLKKNHHITPKHIGIDGCGAAAPFFNIQDIAKLYLDFGLSNDPAYQVLYQSMCKAPFLIGGTNRFDSFFIKLLQGTGISKGGGEGVIGLFLNTKIHGNIAIAVKIQDGSSRARGIAVCDILNHLQALPKTLQTKLNKYCHINRLNHNQIKIGFISTEISKLS
mgnify:CR=1 FL=1